MRKNVFAFALADGEKEVGRQQAEDFLARNPTIDLPTDAAVLLQVVAGRRYVLHLLSVAPSETDQGVTVYSWQVTSMARLAVPRV